MIIRRSPIIMKIQILERLSCMEMEERPKNLIPTPVDIRMVRRILPAIRGAFIKQLVGAKLPGVNRQDKASTPNEIGITGVRCQF